MLILKDVLQQQMLILLDFQEQQQIINITDLQQINMVIIMELMLQDLGVNKLYITEILVVLGGMENRGLTKDLFNIHQEVIQELINLFNMILIMLKVEDLVIIQEDLQDLQQVQMKVVFNFIHHKQIEQDGFLNLQIKLILLYVIYNLDLVVIKFQIDMQMGRQLGRLMIKLQL